MATIVGQDDKVYKRFTCMNCGAIVQYVPNEEVYTGQTDEGCRIKGLNCPGCGHFRRTNP